MVMHQKDPNSTVESDDNSSASVQLSNSDSGRGPSEDGENATAAGRKAAAAGATSSTTTSPVKAGTTPHGSLQRLPAPVHKQQGSFKDRRRSDNLEGRLLALVIFYYY